jgi:hypothetical protein
MDSSPVMREMEKEVRSLLLAAIGRGWQAKRPKRARKPRFMAYKAVSLIPDQKILM